MGLIVHLFVALSRQCCDSGKSVHYRWGLVESVIEGVGRRVGGGLFFRTFLYRERSSLLSIFSLFRSR